MLRSLIYTSNASPGFDERTLPALLSVSRRNNERGQMTGLLLFEAGTFLQVVEGPGESIEALLSRLGADDRHRDLSILYETDSARRYFPDWSMASRELDGPGALSLSAAEMKRRLAPDTPAPFRVMIETFFNVNVRYAA